ncbi:MAG TPA: chorismate synthase, partial [Prolixibacteraceae bacterium]|nr:chorismate synthase [Prolixibacteraceae bacterium]
LREVGVKIQAYVSQVGEVELDKPYQELDLSATENNIVRCPDQETADRMIARIEAAGRNHDTVGGVITGVITGVPAGWGEPVFNKLHASLGFAMLGINAVKGFEYGSGFAGTRLSGSEHNDIFVPDGSAVRTVTNHSGGIQGGISNGEDIYFRVAFKPIATLLKEQQTVDQDRNIVSINPKGRHDPCVLPRAVPIVEAMAALVLTDFYLMSKLYSR